NVVATCYERTIVVATCYELSSSFVDGLERGLTGPTQIFFPSSRSTIKRSNNELETEWTY
ncbi:hypothetical protein DPMN_058535, partial [Dreissena polymorpha]